MSRRLYFRQSSLFIVLKIFQRNENKNLLHNKNIVFLHVQFCIFFWGEMLLHIIKRIARRLTRLSRRVHPVWRWHSWPCWQSLSKTPPHACTWEAGTKRRRRAPTTSSSCTGTAASSTGCCSKTRRRTAHRTWSQPGRSPCRLQNNLS